MGEAGLGPEFVSCNLTQIEVPRRARSIRRAAFRLSAYLNCTPRAVFVQSAARKAPKTTTTTHHYRKKPRRRIRFAFSPVQRCAIFAARRLEQETKIRWWSRDSRRTRAADAKLYVDSLGG